MVTVVKIGGSVLAGPRAFRRVATALGERLASRPGDKLVAVVSAEHGTTDALLALASDVVEPPDPAALDLLWSTGELRSAAILALSLHARGISAVALDVHQAGLTQPERTDRPGAARIRALRIAAALARHDVVVVPGFFAISAGDGVVSLGRGGSDLTAVLLASGVGAARCELIKDVPGYFTADPHADPSAEHLPAISYARALEMAGAGCALVQRQALEAARECRLPLVVRALDGATHTVIEE